jgi:acyl dehydratase
VNVHIDDLPGLTGKRLETSDWIDVTQERVNTFADATDDHLTTACQYVQK